MFAKGTGVCRALENNIHIVSSVVVHVVVGVFFVTGTHRPLSQEAIRNDGLAAGTVVPLPLEDSIQKTSAAVAREDIKKTTDDPNGHNSESTTTFPLLPPGSTEKSAKMSLAMSNSNWANQELAAVPQSIENGQTSQFYEFLHYGKKGSSHSDTEIIGLSEKYIPDNVVGSVVEQFAKCWTIPSDAESDGNIVRINLVLDQNGKVKTAVIADTYLYDHNQSFRALADSALRAVYKCSPLVKLREIDYSLWNEVILTFDPRHAS
ncbi:MAG: hypothetical protein AB8U44_01305 [Aaplasma endosymbiont of Hyalomma asiaticum]